MSFRQRELIYSEAIINCLGIKSKRVSSMREKRAVFLRRALVRNRITGTFRDAIDRRCIWK